MVQPATVVVQAPRFGKQPVMAQCPYCQQQVRISVYEIIYLWTFQGHDEMRTWKWISNMVSLWRLLLIWPLAWMLFDSILSQRHEGHSSHLYKLQENYSRSQNSFLGRSRYLTGIRSFWESLIFCFQNPTHFKNPFRLLSWYDHLWNLLQAWWSILKSMYKPVYMMIVKFHNMYYVIEKFLSHENFYLFGSLLSPPFA